jgi:GNAT superfamily N-acetyltransferase
VTSISAMLRRECGSRPRMDAIVLKMKSLVEPTVRLAAPEDAERIRQLSEELGYPSTAAETLRRLLEISSNPEHAIFVVEVSGAVVGWIHVLVNHSLLTDTPAEIAGLVIDEGRRGRGLGRVLMDRAERWARDKRCPSVRLRSNVVRSRAHAFYERLGYQVIKTQKAFSKDLAE